MDDYFIFYLILFAFFMSKPMGWKQGVKLSEDDLIDLARKQKLPVIITRRKWRSFLGTVYFQGERFYAHSELKPKEWPGDLTVYRQQP